jgi:integrase
MVFEAKKESLRGDGTRGRWRSPIDIHVIPKIGKIRGSEITRHHIYDTLKPIWRTKHPTALKALRRIRMILQSAARMDYPVKPQVVDSAEEMLGHYDHQVTRIRAVDWRDIPDTFQKLPDTTGGRAIAWLMLTLVRMDAGIKARVEEVDLATGIWTVPADRIKGRKGKVQDFRVPLPEQCLVMVREAMLVGSEFIFPGQRRGSAITNVGVEKVLKTIEVPGTPHGFRTSFRTWVQDTDACSFEVAETVLGHAIGGNVERAYARSDLLDRRRPVMEAWAEFVTTDEAVAAPSTPS